MNLNEGKKLFHSFLDAKKIVQKMSQDHGHGFEVYKVGNLWAIGGIHMKKINQKDKIKSFDDIRILLDKFKNSSEDESVEEYIVDIREESASKESSIHGELGEWILHSVDIKLGRDIGMSVSNQKKYLILSLRRDGEDLAIKMGGKFDRHIDLIKRQADSLVGSAINWHTWNNQSSSWSGDSWFYRIEPVE